MSRKPPREVHDGLVTRRAAGLTSAIVAALIAAIVVGSQVLASAGPTTPRPEQPVPAATSGPPDADADDAHCTNDACGNTHSKAVHAWVTCRAVKGNDACTKPHPRGNALGHAKHLGTVPGPASTDGHGHGWGRAHAPGQLKNKDKPQIHPQVAGDPTD